MSSNNKVAAQGRTIGPRAFAESVKASAVGVLQHDADARDDWFAFLEPDILAFHERIQ